MGIFKYKTLKQAKSYAAAVRKVHRKASVKKMKKGYKVYSYDN